VIVAQTGVFKGDVSTDNADVHGRFEGDLVVRKRLLGLALQKEDNAMFKVSAMPAEAGKDPLTGSLPATELPLSMATHGPAPHLVSANSAMPERPAGKPSGRSARQRQRRARPGKLAIESAPKILRYRPVPLVWRAFRSREAGNSGCP